MSQFGAVYERSCRDESGSESEPFGYDPTFLSTSSLYRATNWDAATLDALYAADERRANLVPFGFFREQGARGLVVEKGDEFPVVFDVNLNRSRAFDFVTYLRDGSYLDDQSFKFGARVNDTDPPKTPTTTILQGLSLF